MKINQHLNHKQHLSLKLLVAYIRYAGCTAVNNIYKAHFVYTQSFKRNDNDLLIELFDFYLT